MRTAYRSWEEFERDELHAASSLDESLSDLEVDELDFEPDARGRRRRRDDEE